MRSNHPCTCDPYRWLFRRPWVNSCGQCGGLIPPNTKEEGVQMTFDDPTHPGLPPYPPAETVRAAGANRELTLNRALLFFRPGRADPCAALVVHVHGPAMVNLVWFDHNGGVHAATSVPVLEPGAPAPEHGHFARWPDYKRA